MLKKVVFLDRDGTINQNSVTYVKSESEFTFLPRSVQALRNLTTAGFTLIVITNQSAISRKLLSLTELEKIHSKMKAAVESRGGMIRDIFYCPHLPEDGCDCRKPAPGLIHRARKKHDIDLAAAVMIGDSARDIECAQNAGCGRSILVKTGIDNDAEPVITQMGLRLDYVAKDLFDAARWIIGTLS